MLLTDISSVRAIKEAIPEGVLSPTIAYGEIHLTIAIMMVTTGFVRPNSKCGNSTQSIVNVQSCVFPSVRLKLLK